MVPAQNAGILRSGYFLYSVETLTGHPIPEAQVHAAPALPMLVALALYRENGVTVKT